MGTTPIFSDCFVIYESLVGSERGCVDNSLYYTIYGTIAYCDMLVRLKWQNRRERFLEGARLVNRRLQGQKYAISSRAQSARKIGAIEF